MKTKLPMIAGAAALSAMIGLAVGFASLGASAKTNNVKVAQYVEDVVPAVRQPLPGLTAPEPGRVRDLESVPANDSPVRMADGGNDYVLPVGGASRYSSAEDAFSNGLGSARGAIGRAGRGGMGGSGVVGVTRVASADSGPRGSFAGGAKMGQTVAGQNLAVSADGEQRVAALDGSADDGRSDFNGLVPRTGTSGSVSNTPEPLTASTALPAAPKPPVASAPPPVVAGTDSSLGAPAPAPAVAPAPPAPGVSAGNAAAPGNNPSPAGPAAPATEPPVVADLAPVLPGATTPPAPTAGRPGPAAQPPAITELPLSADALLPTDMERPLSAANPGVEGDPTDGPEVTQIPSPATAALMLVGFAGMSLVRRRARAV